MIRIVVVLPAPLGPTKPYIWPRSTENETPSSALRSPYERRRSISSSTGAAG
jgi:hypothetical protein